MSSALRIEIPDSAAPVPTPSLAPGAMLGGKYRVERELGAGGVGVVTLATHVDLGQRVAIKYLRRSGRSSQAIERLKREAKLAASLHSEHVVKVHDVGARHDGTPFIVMEYLEGEDLSSVVKRGPIAIAQAVRWTLEACHALEEAHALGIVHRDLKPANLFLATRPNGPPIVKVLDFGISKITASGSRASMPAINVASMTLQHETLGTPYYMSPEQLVSSTNVDQRTDIWALGVCLYELLTGHVPFEGHDDLMSLVADILASKSTPVRVHRGEIPTELAAIVHRCITFDMGQRPQSVSAFMDLIRPFASHEYVQQRASIYEVTHSGGESNEESGIYRLNTPSTEPVLISESIPPLPVSRFPLHALIGGASLFAGAALTMALMLGRPVASPAAQSLVAASPPREAIALPLPAETTLSPLPSATVEAAAPLPPPVVHRPVPVAPKPVQSAVIPSPVEQFGDRE